MNPTPVLNTLIQLSQPLHKKLRKGYDKGKISEEQGKLFESKAQLYGKVPDLTDYADLWLSLQLFAAKRTQEQKLHPGSELIDQSAHSIRLIATDLVKIFSGNERWQATQMNIQEASTVCSGLALVRIESQKFIGDIGDIIRHNLKDANGVDLILLTKGAFYMRKFKYTKDIYSMVHAEAMSKYNLRELEPEQV